jgi:hypothetical protein
MVAHSAAAAVARSPLARRRVRLYTRRLAYSLTGSAREVIPRRPVARAKDTDAQTY